MAQNGSQGFQALRAFAMLTHLAGYGRLALLVHKKPTGLVPKAFRSWPSMCYLPRQDKNAKPEGSLITMSNNGIIRDRQSRPVQIWISWAVALLTALYMLPWAIAVTRGKANAGAIGWLNLLLGWTFIGWVVALVMSCAAHQAIAVRQPYQAGQ